MKTRNQLIKEYHILLNQCGITQDGNGMILESYGVTTSKDLTDIQLSDIISKLHEELRKAGKETQPERSEIDKARSRVKAAVGHYLARLGYIAESGWGLREWNAITKVTCRAAKYDDFNRIPVERLRSLYNAFTQRTKDMKAVDELTYELLLQPKTIQGEA